MLMAETWKSETVVFTSVDQYIRIWICVTAISDFAAVLGPCPFWASKIDFVRGYINLMLGRSYLVPNEINFRGQSSSLRTPTWPQNLKFRSQIFKNFMITQLSYTRIFTLYRASAINVGVTVMEQSESLKDELIYCTTYAQLGTLWHPSVANSTPPPLWN